jgi:hypothetical protein
VLRLHEADKLRDRVNHEADPNIRGRLNRMTDIYDHIAKIESGNHGGSVDAMMGPLSCCRFDKHRDQVFNEAGGCYAEMEIEAGV